MGAWRCEDDRGGAGMSDVWTDVRFWSLVMGDLRRTILCSPDMESRMKGIVDSYGVDGFITVLASPYVPDDKVYVIDNTAVESTLARLNTQP
jgi:hypothetical protein